MTPVTPQNPPAAGKARHLRAAALFAVAVLATLSASWACDSGSSSPASPTAAPTTAPTVEPTGSSTPPAGGPPSIDLASDSPLLTIYGAGSGDLRSDIPGLAAGDFNDDGFPDLLVGARFADGPDDAREDAGEAYVVFGGEQLPASVDIAAGEQGLTILGGVNGGGLGFAAAAGDVNDDGIEDIIVAAPFAQSQGIAYVVFGRADLAGVVDLAAGQQDLALRGPGTGADLFGDSMDVGDVNGDGSPDLVVGATFASDEARDAGQVGAVYAFFGPLAPGALETEQGDHDAVLFAPDTLDELGDTVVVGDVNGDEIDDIIATAEAADGPDNDRETGAEVHVLFGSPDLGGELRIADGDADVSVYAAEDHDTLGFSLASGDLNGDRIDDIIMGARLADGPDNRRDAAGEVYVLYGGDDLPATLDLADDSPDLTIFGADTGDFLGSSEAVGDLDGDGANELVLGTGFGQGPANDRFIGGEARVVGPLPETGALDLAGDATLAAVYGVTGEGLAAALLITDLDGDGVPELAAVAATAPGSGGLPEAGRVYLVEGVMPPP